MGFVRFTAGEAGIEPVYVNRAAVVAFLRSAKVTGGTFLVLAAAPSVHVMEPMAMVLSRLEDDRRAASAAAPADGGDDEG